MEPRTQGNEYDIKHCYNTTALPNLGCAVEVGSKVK